MWYDWKKQRKHGDFLVVGYDSPPPLTFNTVLFQLPTGGIFHSGVPSDELWLRSEAARWGSGHVCVFKMSAKNLSPSSSRYFFTWRANGTCLRFHSSREKTPPVRVWGAHVRQDKPCDGTQLTATVWERGDNNNQSLRLGEREILHRPSAVPPFPFSTSSSSSHYLLSRGRAHKL